MICKWKKIVRGCSEYSMQIIMPSHYCRYASCLSTRYYASEVRVKCVFFYFIVSLKFVASNLYVDFSITSVTCKNNNYNMKFVSVFVFFMIMESWKLQRQCLSTKFSVIIFFFKYFYQQCKEHGQCRVHFTMLINRLDANWNMTIVSLRHLRQVNECMSGNSGYYTIASKQLLK